MAWSFVGERVSRTRNYWVATTHPDGRPHVAPVSGLWVDGTFCFGGDPRSRKARNLAENPNVVAHLESAEEVVILEGAAEVISDPNPALTERISDAMEATFGVRPPSHHGPLRRASARRVRASRPRVAFARRVRVGGGAHSDHRHAPGPRRR